MLLSLWTVDHLPLSLRRIRLLPFYKSLFFLMMVYLYLTPYCLWSESSYSSPISYSSMNTHVTCKKSTTNVIFGSEMVTRYTGTFFWREHRESNVCKTFFFIILDLRGVFVIRFIFGLCLLVYGILRLLYF